MPRTTNWLARITAILVGIAIMSTAVTAARRADEGDPQQGVEQRQAEEEAELPAADVRAGWRGGVGHFRLWFVLGGDGFNRFGRHEIPNPPMRGGSARKTGADSLSTPS